MTGRRFRVFTGVVRVEFGSSDLRVRESDARGYFPVAELVKHTCRLVPDPTALLRSVQ